ncbi:TonB-linked SusC/RagA family outer membrane protein [Algoriphagus sp. 4150]|uniref:SusC/RagA family TonB-linked outer membrane protein n=1 Tax=Algoriphagus sp. 4150 TaxID=2817756 RepID=UPI0028589CB6|nr:SusC/RagA family TonB-linked outer membrane protein [Algoriphagus sp. 4150]MDR7130985.1 TonB-linked SusC/RagA family outer membrane protein [Algoriphagus sp. 4150]
MKNLLTLLLGMLITLACFAQNNHAVKGTVIDRETGETLLGVLIRVTPVGISQVSGDLGEFSLLLPSGKHVITFSHFGYIPQTLELSVEASLEDDLEISLVMSDQELAGVEVVSTGYQQLPKERVTGSFVQVDQELVNRSVTPDILQRLESVTPGLIFNRDRTGDQNNISIRGTSTIFSENQPLIVVDNFPYDGPIDQINPNDVESMTVLKDAAAASIWGARAGNGVIVITTKSAKYGQSLKVSLNANVTLTEQPDLFHAPQMDVSDFVDVEEMLYNQGFYNSLYNSTRNRLVSPVVETLFALQNGDITGQEAERLMAGFRSTDFRDEKARHLMRSAVNQQYALDITGGGTKSKHVFSLGYDNNLPAEKGNSRNRLTLNSRNNWKFMEDRLGVMAGIYLSRQQAQSGAPGTGGLDPYAKLADNEGNPLPVYYGLSNRFVQAAPENGFLDWSYVPLNEVGLDPLRSASQDLRLNTQLSYRILDGLSAELSYQFWQNQNRQSQLYPMQSYFARNLINTYTQTDPLGVKTFPIPRADILDRTFSFGRSHTYRGMVSFDRVYEGRHAVNAIAGFEVRDFQSETDQARTYGYSDATGIIEPVDYLTRWTKASDRFTATIPFANGFTANTDRYLSAYINAGYTLDNKFSVTGSIRRDASNLFGVNTNQKFVPLWSAGLGYTLSEENFLQSTFVDFIRLRASYGFNGNTDKRVTAYPSGRLFPGSINHFTYLPFTRIDLPGNPELRWERIKIINLGTDFNLFGDRFSGTLEWFFKNGLDIIGDYSLASSTGFSSLRGNYANTLTKGFDFSSRVGILKSELRWDANFFLSHLNEKVSKYEGKSLASNYLQYGSGIGGIFPYEGRPLAGIYSYEWAMLDPVTGAPRGVLEGQPSTDYSAIIGQTTPEELVFHGSGRPTWFGALRNDLYYKGLNLSVNISYRLGYYIRRPSIDYYTLLGGEISHSDYARRWLSPGDEQITQIPSMPEVRDSQQSAFYLNSAALVEKGDHIRLQDIRLSYTIPEGKSILSNAEIYSYINNVGLLWKSSDEVADPDFQFSKPMRSYALGIRMSF